ncbi:hypothetical protein ABK040_003729 [Willaertia magna]
MNTSYIAQVEESIVVAVTEPVELVEEEDNALKRKRETKEENEEEKEEAWGADRWGLAACEESWKDKGSSACEKEPTLETTDNNVGLTQEAFEESIITPTGEPKEDALIETPMKKTKLTEEVEEEEKEDEHNTTTVSTTTEQEQTPTSPVGSSTSLDEENEVPTFFYEDPERAVSFYKIVLGLEIQPIVEEKGEDVDYKVESDYFKAKLSPKKKRPESNCNSSLVPKIMVPTTQLEITLQKIKDYEGAHVEMGNPNIEITCPEGNRFLVVPTKC